MKLYELQDPVAAAKEMEDLNAQMVAATGEYRALRTPASLKKIKDLEAKIQKILVARGKIYGAGGNGNLAEAPMTPYKAMSEIRKIAYNLKLASGWLMRFYKQRLDRFKNPAKTIRATERDLNVPPGTLNGFDTLYDIATA
jgi:hypothetical protein